MSLIVEVIQEEFYKLGILGVNSSGMESSQMSLDHGDQKINKNWALIEVMMESFGFHWKNLLNFTKESVF